MLKTIPVILVLLLMSCTYINTPVEVTTRFWKAMELNDMEQAQKYAVPGSMENSKLAEDSDLELISVAEKAVTKKGKAWVETEIKTTRNMETSVYKFDTVLVQLNDEWKVDYRETVNSLMMSSIREFGNDLRRMGKEMGKALGEAMKEMGKAMEEVFDGPADTGKDGKNDQK